MKTLFFALILLLSINPAALGQSQKINLEIDLVQPLFGGVGGTIGLEDGHWGYGVMAFSTPLNEKSRDFIFVKSGEYDVDNQGVEFYYNYYFNSNHLGFFWGALLSYDVYELKDNDVKIGTVYATYLAPELGYRFELSSSTYLQATLAIPIKVQDDADKITEKEIELESVLTLPLLTVGVKF
ncbi:MAG: hypothetical protein COB67_05725 [SAR324 cluster bacterium]|uniref:Outer membrane protein beta-barrel domain-containing protein n=1 Tax=SAR324 cluster bacterium TaxID=2024889 RepID=A0A2A4T5W9_9DELT|nr:MAG: hypothetical protein COB67_05725 [SAR324 cluster bacterium]